MTIFATTCFAYAVIRCMEELIRFCVSLISRLTNKNKVEKVVVNEWKRLSANVSPALHAIIKAHAQLLDLTITDYLLIAVHEKLERDNRG